MGDFQVVPGEGENPHGTPLEQRLVIAWRRWERSPESRENVLDKEAILSAFCEGEELRTNQLHDKITELRRAGVKLETAIRIGVVGLSVEEGEG